MNAASQATVWAHALTAAGIQSESFAHDGLLTRLLRPGTKVTARAGRSLPHYRLAPSIFRKNAARSAMRSLTHILNEGNLAFASDPRTSSFVDEARAGLFGHRILGVVFHGTDARDPALAKELDRASFFFDADPDWAQLVGKRAARNRSEVAELGVPTFVTTPDMLPHVPGARLLPISVNSQDWATARPAMDRAVPRVLHRSSGGTYTKGSKYILPVLHDLARSGRIELVSPPVLPHETMAKLIKTSDIIVDQLQTGTYGVTGVEGLAAGRLVVASLTAHLRIPDLERPPIVHATPTTFEAAIDEVLETPDAARSLAERGPDFVARVHDGRAAARILHEFVNEPRSAAKF